MSINNENQVFERPFLLDIFFSMSGKMVHYSVSFVYDTTVSGGSDLKARNKPYFCTFILQEIYNLTHDYSREEFKIIQCKGEAFNFTHGLVVLIILTLSDKYKNFSVVRFTF